MTRPIPQLQFSLVWADSDVHEVVVYVRSEHFSGATSLYVAPGDLARLADNLRGFPSSSPEDRRIFVLGQPDLPNYGEVRGELYCRDSIGHIGVHIRMQCTPYDSSDKPESCSVLLRVVPSDLDRFVEELRCLGEQGQSATLTNTA